MAQNPTPHIEDTWPNGYVDPENYSTTIDGAVNGTVFHLSYPANCPYALAVGVTMLDDSKTVRDAESAMHEPLIDEIIAAPKLKHITPPQDRSSSSE